MTHTPRAWQFAMARPADRAGAQPHPRADQLVELVGCQPLQAATDGGLPASVAATATASTAARRCRTPRGLRGSGTCASTASRPTETAGISADSPEGAPQSAPVAGVGQDDTAGTATPVKDETGVVAVIIQGAGMPAHAYALSACPLHNRRLPAHITTLPTPCATYREVRPRNC